MDKNEVKRITENLKKFSSVSKDSDYISVTEWTNGEGWDFDVNGNVFSLHYSELDAINYLVKVMEYDFEDK